MGFLDPFQRKRMHRGFSRRATLFLASVICAALCSPTGARVIYVDRDATGAGTGASWQDAFRSITAGVAAAVDRDEIWVAEGIYAERISLGKPLHLYGGFSGTETRRSQRDWKMHPTTVNAFGGGSVFALTEPCRIDGFRITGGVNGQGAGGVVCTARGMATLTTTTIANCRLDSNAGSYGGALYGAEDRIELIGCEVIKNSSGAGGAIYAINCRLVLDGCLVDGNVGVGECGGILGRADWTGLSRQLECSIVATTITANQTTGIGGGVLMTGGTHGRVHFTAYRCYIADNQAGIGAGLRLLGLAEINDCLIVNNRADAIGGAFDCYQAIIRIDNCTISRNTAVQTGAISNWEGRFFVFNSIVYDNGPGPIAGEDIAIRYSCIDGDYPGEEGCITANPAFVAPLAGNFRLGPSSVCIDAGTNNELSPLQTIDFDGRPRVVDGNRDGLAIVDMGCFETLYWTDLAIRDFDFAPRSIDPGEPIHFAGRVVNRGNQPTTGSFWIEFLASSWPDFRHPRYYLCPSVLVTNHLAPGQAVDLARVTRTLDPWPSGPPGGRFYVLIRVDPLNEIEERDETNNRSWVPSHRLCVGPCPTEAETRWVHYR